MIIEDRKFYFIKDEFFDIFKDYKLMKTKKVETKDLATFVLEIEKIKK